MNTNISGIFDAALDGIRDMADIAKADANQAVEEGRAYLVKIQPDVENLAAMAAVNLTEAMNALRGFYDAAFIYAENNFEAFADDERRAAMVALLATIRGAFAAIASLGKLAL